MAVYCVPGGAGPAVGAGAPLARLARGRVESNSPQGGRRPGSPAALPCGGPGGEGEVTSRRRRAMPSHSHASSPAPPRGPAPAIRVV